MGKADGRMEGRWWHSGPEVVAPWQWSGPVFFSVLCVVGFPLLVRGAGAALDAHPS